MTHFNYDMNGFSGENPSENSGSGGLGGFGDSGGFGGFGDCDDRDGCDFGFGFDCDCDCDAYYDVIGSSISNRKKNRRLNWNHCGNPTRTKESQPLVYGTTETSRKQLIVRIVRSGDRFVEPLSRIDDRSAFAVRFPEGFRFLRTQR